jgi:membrane protein DedA with SNARE-associated domain
MSAVTHLLSHWGYVALLMLTVAEAACVPIPSEVTLGFAGYLASTHRLELVPVILLATLGETVGAFIGYGVGRTGGRALIERLGRYVLLTKSDLDRAQGWFERRGETAVLIGRVLPIVRTFISLPAGVGEMSPVRFGAFTVIGSGAWCTALAVTGYELGGKWNETTKGFSDAGYVIAAVVVVAIVVFVAHRLMVLRRERRAAQALGLVTVGGQPGNSSEE